jgi:quinol monooxygenase YgiN
MIVERNLIDMNRPLYVIVRFELKKGEVEILAPLIREFFEKEVSAVPGFLSARLHTNDEGSVLINYASWESDKHFFHFVKEIATDSDISKKIQRFAQRTDCVFELPLV